MNDRMSRKPPFPYVEEIGEPLVLHSARQLRVNSSLTGRDYRIQLAAPRTPAPPEGYPILYLLDGNATFFTATDAVRVQCWLPDGYAPPVVVGIGYETDEPYSVPDRTVDYTTPADPANLTRRPDGQLPQVGGADRFLDFIETELKPLVGNLFPVDPARQSLFGHSFGGMFAMHAFMQRTAAFSTFVAGSPSLWWNGREQLRRLEAFAAGSLDLAGRRLMIGYGTQERDDIVEGSQTAIGLMAPLVARGLTFRAYAFEGEGHMSVLPALVSRAVGFALSPPDTLDRPKER